MYYITAVAAQEQVAVVAQAVLVAQQEEMTVALTAVKDFV
jgi:hypothetical protein